MVYQLALACQFAGRSVTTMLPEEGVVIRLAGDGPPRFGPSIFLGTPCCQCSPPGPKSESIQAHRAPPPPPSPRRSFTITLPARGRSQPHPNFSRCRPPAPSDPGGDAESCQPLYRYPFTNCTPLRPPPQHHSRHPLRPGQHQHGRVPHVPYLPGRVQRSPQPPLPTPSRWPAIAAAPRSGSKSARGDVVPTDDSDSLDPLDQVCQLLLQGEIVAIKGIGGIHLACDCHQRKPPSSQLRQRKTALPQTLCVDGAGPFRD